MDGHLLYGDLTYNIRKCIYDVHNRIGVGFDEETYHQGLIRKFKNEGISFVSKERKQLKHRNVSIQEFVLDFLIEDKIILSLKCLPCDFLQVNFIQLFAELKIWKKQLGLMANFGLPDVNIERIIYHEKSFTAEENYDYIKNEMTENDREILRKIRQSIILVGKIQGFGFNKRVYRKLINTELAYQKIKIENGITIPVNYQDELIRNYKMRYLLIEDKIVCHVTALQDTITHYDISTVKSYLQALKLKIGLVINYGKSLLEIRGVRG